MSTPTPLRDAVLAALAHISPEDLSFVEELRQLYSPDVEFEDPVQKVQGV